MPGCCEVATLTYISLKATLLAASVLPMSAATTDVAEVAESKFVVRSTRTSFWTRRLGDKLRRTPAAGTSETVQRGVQVDKVMS